MSQVNYFRTSNAILRALVEKGDANAQAELDRRKARRREKAASGQLGFVQSLLAGEAKPTPKARAKAKAASPKAKAGKASIEDAAKLLGVPADKLSALVALLRA